METINIEVMQDASEIIQYNFPDIPVAIQDRLLSRYANMRALCHWHEDIECIYILEGEMFYNINGKEHLLKEGDILFVNSGQLHYGFSNKRHECHFYCFIFHPALLNVNKTMYRRFVRPIIENTGYEYWLFSSSSDVGMQLSSYLAEITEIPYQKTPVSVYRITGIFQQIWSILFQNAESTFTILDPDVSSDILLQKKMVTFIRENYAENIELNDIAASANISRNKCCQLFQRMLQASPISYLNSYRLEISCHLLKNTNYKITQIAISCGYNHCSYYSKIFAKKYGCTPNEYRKAAS